VSDGQRASVHKGMGLVSHAFTEDSLAPLQGYLAIGHNRYSTSGSSRLQNAQPYLIETALGPLGVAHNGNLTNGLRLRRQLLERGVGLAASSDSEVITQMLAGAAGNTWEERIIHFMEQAEGAYALTILTREAVYGIRDPHGFRPLCLGRVNGEGWVLASESCALTTIGAEFVREVRPGEVVRLSQDGIHTFQAVPAAPQGALCVFEYVYFARPDSILSGHSIHGVRRRLGRRLAREHPVRADMVMGVPDSAISAAIGYATESGIPYGEGLIRNRYIGRTFIQPDARLRKMGVKLKFNPLQEALEGRRIILVDDSIVRGTTSAPIITLLRNAGAREVHVRVSSPPICFPCFMGVDMASQEELIAANCTVEETRDRIGADSLGHLSLEGMLWAIDRPSDGHCMACFTGRYPLALDQGLSKIAMEPEAVEEVS